MMEQINVKEALIDCKEISSDIMSKVSSVLTSEGVEYTQSSDSEIIVNNKTKSEVKDILKQINDITKQQMKLILQVSNINGTTFIRQKFN